jgi:hypothetical protein
MLDRATNGAGADGGAEPRRALRIAAISGAIGDYAGAMAAAVQGEPVDVLVGDYLAEFTMARVIAGLASLPAPQPPTVYFYREFLNQLAPQLEAIAARGLKVVVNAGAFAPAQLAAAVRGAVREAGLSLSVAHVQGDDLFPRLDELTARGLVTHLDTGRPPGPLQERIVAANAYIGGWGIAAALEAGADIVICGRVSDASLVLGPAAWWHGWARDEWDKLAGAVAAGHLIECGAQANGGNFAGFASLRRDLRLGYPIAEVEADGQVVITKRAAEGGAVTVDTVTAQLLYEVQGPRYLNPDVVLCVDSVQLSQDGPDRVRLSGVTGEPPPPTTKLGCFYMNGWRCSLWAFAVGLEVEEKLEWLDMQMRSVAEALALEEYRFEPCGQAVLDPQTEAAASAPVRIAAWSQDRAAIGKFLEGYASFALGGIPGFHGDGTKGPEMRVDFWPGLVPQAEIRHQVVLDDGRELEIALPPTAPLAPSRPPRPITGSADHGFSGATRRRPLGELVYARSGDKGGDASLGVWSRDPAAWGWLRTYLTSDRLRQLLSLRQDVGVEVHEMANLSGLLVILKGYFGESGSGNIALDPIGKGLGEFLRARLADVPVELVEPARAPELAPTA